MFKMIILLVTPLLLLALPSNPLNLTFSDVTQNSVVLHWEHDATDTKGFKIYRGEDYITTVKNYVKSFHDTGLQAHTTYEYIVKATDDMIDTSSPFGVIFDNSPTLTWRYKEGASYHLLVKPLSEDGVTPDWNRIVYEQTLTEAEANCDNIAKTCSFTPNINIKGDHVWWVEIDNNWSERGYFSVNGYGDLDDGKSGISKGYGVWGNYAVEKSAVVESMPDDQNVKVEVTTYKPTAGATKKPAIFFIAGYARDADSYDKLLNFLASHGYYVVHLYHRSSLSLERSYDDYFKMVEKVVTDHGAEIDTTKMGVMGHSLGGGTAIWLGKKLFGNQAGEKNWGQSGSFVFALSPWYAFYLTKDNLDHYPTNTKLLIQLSEDEIIYEDGQNNTRVATNKRSTDPRIARAILENIAIPDENKDLVIVHSDNQSYNFDGKTYTYQADHYLSYTKDYDVSIYGPHEYQPYDMLDVLLLNRLSHAMINYAFYNDNKAKAVALGDGSIQQITMSSQEITLTPLSVPKPYTIQRAQDEYVFPCSDGGWTTYWYMKDYCGN